MVAILVIEDVEAVRRSLAAELRRAGHDVTAAANGREGVECLSRWAFDVVVVDVWMPEMDGITFLRTVKASHPRTRFLAVSGGSPMVPLSQTETLAETFGADAILYKPVEREPLLAQVDALIATLPLPRQP